MFIFIISWQGQHENAILIANQILHVHNKVTIVYSDPDPNFILNAPCEALRRPNELFWEDKFKACLDATGDNGILIIHADCTCEDWGSLVKRCNDINLSIKNIGVWAPEIDGTYWNLNVSGVMKTKNSDLVLSALTDGIVFYLSPQIVNRMRKVKYGNNKFGWCIDGLFCSTAYVTNKLVVIDTKIKVFHPQKRGYDKYEAEESAIQFLNQFSLQERLMYELLRGFVKNKHAKLTAYKKKNLQHLYAKT